ncbi:MAG: nucleotide exchange factor GrpE [Actinomycetota bacterium]|nr:nucleotide exchange factor GrpE [Actinomycetota bacterium]
MPEDPVTPVADASAGSDSSSPADAAQAEAAAGAAPAEPPGDVEGLIADLERASHERDEFLEALRRTQADFENYRKRIMKQQADDVARAAESLVEKLLPVLDACDGAVRHGAVEVEPVYAALLGALEKEGLGRIDPVGEPFDPNLHDAVMHEAAGDDETTIVSDVMRPGYSWKGRVVRPAMVKVRG